MINDKLNGQTLAYVGDAYWSLLVRKYLIDKGITKAIDLQKNSIKFVSAKAQANFFDIIKEGFFVFFVFQIVVHNVDRRHERFPVIHSVCLLPAFSSL